MKRYFVRFVGTVLSALTAFLTTDRAESAPHFDYEKTFTLGNDKYTITVYTGAAWYVGWVNLNPKTNSDATVDSRWNNVWRSYNAEYYDQPMVIDYNATSGSSSSGYTGVLISERRFTRQMDSYNPIKFSRYVDSDAEQYLLFDKWVNWIIDMPLLAYSRSSSTFTNVGCCQYTPTGHTPGSYGFSYSGDGRAADVCPCFYTTADKVYTGNSCEQYQGRGKDFCTGTSVMGVGDETSSNWPAVVRDVFFCYTYSGCTSSDTMYKSFDPVNYTGLSGCHMIRVPMVGLVGAYENDLQYNVDYVLFANGSVGFNVFNPELVEEMDCEAGSNNQKFMSCASGATPNLGYLTYGGTDGCYTCPTVAGISVGGYALSNTSFYVDEETAGVGACKFIKPTSSDTGGVFELTTYAGASQTCYGFES